VGIYHITNQATGEHYYLLPPAGYGATWIGDGQPLTRVRGEWWKTSGRLVTLTAQHADKTTTTGYEIEDPSAVSERFPATLTVAKYEDRTDDEDDYTTAPERSLYRPITRTEPGKAIMVDLSGTVELDGEPAPDDGRTWVAQLPYELSNHCELLHMFPGHLRGFPGALRSALDAIPGVSAYDNGEFTVYIRRHYSPAVVRMVKDSSRPRSKKLVEQERHDTGTYVLSPPNLIYGKNRAAAVAEWDRLMGKYVATVSEAAMSTPCGHCHGTGLAEIKSLTRKVFTT
jgi:hypothetical protein